MTLPTLSPRTPTTVVSVKIAMSTTLVFDEESEEYLSEDRKRASFALKVLDENGNPMPSASISGDLIPHITAEQTNWLVQFLNDMRTLAEGAIPTT